MGIQKFVEKYPDFSNISFEFHYPEGLDTPHAPNRTDEQIAHDLVYKDSEKIRPEVFRQWLRDLISDAHRVRADIADNWQALTDEVNRCLYTEEEAAAWLDRMIAVWERELAKLEPGEPPK